MQEYLTSSIFSLQEKTLLFKLRTRMFEAKGNFPSRYFNRLQCDYCQSDEDQTQRHLLENCEKIISKSKAIFNNIDIDHDFIYGSIDEQRRVTKLFMDIEQILTDMNSSVNGC